VRAKGEVRFVARALREVRLFLFLSTDAFPRVFSLDKGVFARSRGSGWWCEMNDRLTLNFLLLIAVDGGETAGVYRREFSGFCASGFARGKRSESVAVEQMRCERKERRWGDGCERYQIMCPSRG